MQNDKPSLRKFMDTNPMVGILIFVAIGICIGLYTQLSLIWSILPFLIATPLYTVGVILSKNVVRLRSSNRLQSIAIGFVLIGTGMLAGTWGRPLEMDYDTEILPVIARGCVKDVRTSGATDKLLIDVTSLSDPFGKHILVTHGLLAEVRVESSDVQPYDIVEFRQNFQTPAADPNTQEQSSLRWQRLRGVVAVDYVQSEDLHVVGHEKSLMAMGSECRSDIEEVVDRTPLSADTKGLLKALLLGDKNDLGPDTRQEFSQAGLSHVLALSGMHMAIIFGIVILLLWPLRILIGFKWCNAVAILVLWIYLFITGCPISAVRAVVMLTAVLVGQILERSNSAINALCLAALLILVVSPISLQDPAFQLSFVCVAVFLLFDDFALKRNKKSNVTLLKIGGIIISSMLALIVSWALTAYYFHTVQFASVLYNLPVMLLLPIYLITAALYLGLFALGLNLGWLAKALDGSFHFFSDAILPLSSATATDLWVSWITPALWLVAIFILAAAIKLQRRSLGYLAGSLAALAILAIPLFPAEKPLDGYIVRTERYSLSVAHFKDGREERVTLPLTRDQVLDMDGERWVILATPGPKQLDKLENRDCDFLLVANQFSAPLDKTLEKYHPSAVVIHRSVYPRFGEKMEEELKASGMSVHNMHSQGPLRRLRQR